MTPTLFVTRCLVGSGISFLSMAASCMLIYPEIFQHYEYGVSYFGSISSTLIPYYLGFALTNTFTLLIARRLQQITKPLSVAFYALAICMTGVAATSYSLNQIVYAVHWAFAITLAACILITILWLIKQGGLAWSEWFLIGVIVITIALSALPIIHDIPLVKIYILRELLVFICSLWLFGCVALKITTRAERNS